MSRDVGSFQAEVGRDQGVVMADSIYVYKELNIPIETGAGWKERLYAELNKHGKEGWLIVSKLDRTGIAAGKDEGKFRFTCIMAKELRVQ